MNVRIVTVTPNPSLDRTIEPAGELQRGAVQRATRSTAEPGGKGVNVSRVVVASGGDTVAVLPGDEPRPGPARPGHTRDPDGRAADRGAAPVERHRDGADRHHDEAQRTRPSLAGRLDDLAALVADTAAATATGPAARWVVVAGSLPPGLPDDALAVLVRAVRARHGADVRIAVDSSGVPFTALLQSGERIDLVKPNAEELAEVVGGDPEEYERDLDAAVAVPAAAAEERRHGPAHPGQRRRRARLRRGRVRRRRTEDRRPVDGRRGDSSLAGYLLAEVAGASPEQRLAQAVATGAAAAALPGSDVPALDHTDPTAVSVRVLDTHPAPEPA